MIPKVIGLIMVIIGGISLFTIIACMVKSMYDGVEDCEDCEDCEV